MAPEAPSPAMRAISMPDIFHCSVFILKIVDASESTIRFQDDSSWKKLFKSKDFQKAFPLYWALAILDRLTI